MAESVKEKIFVELEKLLLGIKSTSGYVNTVAKVYTEVVMPGELKEFPAIVIDQGQEKQVATPSKGLIEKIMTVYLDCYLYDSNHLAKAIRTIERDIEKLMYGDVYGAGRGFSINGSAFECKIIGSEPFGTVTEAPNGGVTIELQIWYHQRITDPTLKS
jgi:hypothetical protein